jgi:large subunit ribosomal protein L28
MAKCALTGKKVSFGRNIRFSASGSSWLRRAPKTNRTFKANIHRHQVYVPELGETVTLNLSAKALRTITRRGLLQALRDQGKTLKQVKK